MKLNAYLSFPGTCEEAIHFYHDVLGGEIAAMVPYEGSPADAMASEGWKHKIMHATLKIGDMDLMASDVGPERFVEPQGYHLSIAVDQIEEAERIFRGLSDGGRIVMPLESTFWAERFGMLTDRYGINWMVNCDAKTAN